MFDQILYQDNLLFVSVGSTMKHLFTNLVQILDVLRKAGTIVL